MAAEDAVLEQVEAGTVEWFPDERCLHAANEEDESNRVEQVSDSPHHFSLVFLILPLVLPLIILLDISSTSLSFSSSSSCSSSSSSSSTSSSSLTSFSSSSTSSSTSSAAAAAVPRGGRSEARRHL